MSAKSTPQVWTVWGIQENENQVRLVSHDGRNRFVPADVAAAAPEGLSLAEHIAAMATDPYLCGHPEWEHIVAEAQALIAKATP